MGKYFMSITLPETTLKARNGRSGSQGIRTSNSPCTGTKTREWWYASVEEPKQVALAMRFVLSQKGVATALPTSFVELLDKAIDAAKVFQPLDTAAIDELQQMSSNRESIFLDEEKQVSFNYPHGNPHFAHSHQEDCEQQTA